MHSFIFTGLELELSSALVALQQVKVDESSMSKWNPAQDMTVHSLKELA